MRPTPALIRVKICCLLADDFEADLIQTFLHVGYYPFLLYDKIQHGDNTNGDSKKQPDESDRVRKWYLYNQQQDEVLNLLVYFQSFITVKNFDEITVTRHTHIVLPLTIRSNIG